MALARIDLRKPTPKKALPVPARPKELPPRKMPVVPDKPRRKTRLDREFGILSETEQMAFCFRQLHRCFDELAKTGDMDVASTRIEQLRLVIERANQLKLWDEFASHVRKLMKPFTQQA